MHKSTKINSNEIPKVTNLKVKKRHPKGLEEGTASGGTASLILNQSQIILNKNGSFIQSPVNNVSRKTNLNVSQIDANIIDSSAGVHVTSFGNKEKVIKQLQTENKQIKSEHELLKKESRVQKSHIEQLEKQIEKSKTCH